MGDGWIVVLNGAPRAGKSSIVTAVQEGFEEPWLNLGVDVFCQGVTPPRYRPGMGLRPDGGERSEIEVLLPALYGAFWDSVAAHSRHGLNVVCDVGLHDAYATPLGILPDAARRLRGLPALLIGIRCPVEEIMRRRDAEPGGYATSGPDGEVPEAVLRWERHVHDPCVYDLEIDTSRVTPDEAVKIIGERLAGPPPTAFWQLAR